MMTEIGSALYSFGLNIVSSLVTHKLLNKDDKKIKDEILEKISIFDENFSPTEVDGNYFQEFLRQSETINRIFIRIFLPKTKKRESDLDFAAILATEAISYVNEKRTLYGWAKIKNEGIFVNYFQELLRTLKDIRENILDIEHKAQTGILIEGIQTSEENIVRAITGIIDKDKGDNVFAIESLRKIELLVDLYNFSDAEKEISRILEEKDHLSLLQKEFVYFQKSQIFMNTGKHGELKEIKDKISKMNSSSKYVLEINYHIACSKRDAKMVNDIIKKLAEIGYSDEDLLLKKTRFDLLFEKTSINQIIENNAIINSLKENHEAHYFYGNFLIESEKYIEAKNEYETAYRLKNIVIYKYNALIAQSVILLENANLQRSDTNEFLEDVKKTLSELEEVGYFIKFLPKKNRTSYWIYFIDLSVILDVKKALTIFDRIDGEISQCEVLKSMKANVLISNGLNLDAKSILSDLWSYLPENTSNYFYILSQENNWDEIISKFSNLKKEEFTNNPRILALFLKATYEKEGYDKFRERIRKFLFEDYSKSVVLIEIMRISLLNQDDEIIQEICKIIIQHKNIYSDSDISFMCDLLIKYRKFQFVFPLVEDKIVKNERFCDVFVRSVEISSLEGTNIDATYATAKALHSKGCKYKSLLKLKVILEFKNLMSRKARNTLIELKSLFGLDEFYSYYFIAVKINIGDLEDLEEEARILLNSRNPMYMQMVAALKAKQGKWDESQRISLRALFTDPDNISLDFLNSYITLNLDNTNKHLKEVEFEKSQINSVVTLKSEHGLRNIAIHEDSTLYDDPGEFLFECENYGPNDEISLVLILSGYKGTKISLQNVQYEVIEIVDSNAYFFRFCLKKIHSDYPTNETIKPIFTTNTNDPTSAFIDSIKSIDEKKDAFLDDYNFKNKIGLPVSYLSRKEIFQYSETLRQLLFMEDQLFYSGHVVFYENREYVLTLSSIILLATFDLLPKIVKISNKCSITKDVFDCLKKGARESLKVTETRSAVVSVSKEGRLIGHHYTEEDKFGTKAFWANIIGVIASSGISVVDIEAESSEVNDMLSSYCFDEDLSSIELCRKHSKILVCDDLFIQTMYLPPENNSTNIVGLLVSENLVSNFELIDLILVLTQNKYIYSLNSELLIRISKWINLLENIDEKQVQTDKLRLIYSAMFSENSGSFYSEINRKFIEMAFDEGIDRLWIYNIVKK